MKPTPAVDLARLKGRRFGELTCMLWAAGTLYAAYFIAHYIFLIYVYGFSRVRADHLYFVTTPKVKAWIVSNGDRLVTGHFIHFLISLGLWWILFLGTFPLISRMLPATKNDNKEPPQAPEPTAPSG